jgi:hypothetical protein
VHAFFSNRLDVPQFGVTKSLGALIPGLVLVPVTDQPAKFEMQRQPTLGRWRVEKVREGFPRTGGDRSEGSLTRLEARDWANLPLTNDYVPQLEVERQA